MSFYYSVSLQTLTFEKMSEHYDSLLKSGLQSDVVLVSGEKELRMHKVILSARSPVFAAMFAHASTKEAQENRVEIVDMDGEALELFVRYIYTGKVKSLDQFAGDLLIAADKYQLASLKSICEAQLLSVVVTTENASDLLFIADMYQIAELATKCLKYIAHNGTEVIATEGWEKIRMKPHLLEKLLELLSAKFTKVFKSGDRYGKMAKKFISGQKPTPFAMASFEDLIFKEMSEQYESLLKSELLSDVALVASGGKELKVHKVVLSTRSPVFASLFSRVSVTEEAQKNRFEITNVDVKVVEMFVRYIYSGKVDDYLDQSAALDLFLTADKYQLNCLKSICEYQLMHQITTESAFDLLFFAEMHGATELFTAALDYFIGYSTEMMASSDWKKKIVPRTDLVAKLYERLNESYLSTLEFIDYRKVVEPKKKVEVDYSGKDWTVRADLDFAKDLMRNSNAPIKDEKSDVTLVVGDAEFNVHKKVLSAGSPIFAALFANSTNHEAEENRVQITDVDGEVLKLLIKYIYTGKVGWLNHNAGKLLVVADKYQMDRLKSICVQQLLFMVITIELVLDLLILADIYQITKLYTKCVDYIIDNITQVISSEGWKKVVIKTGLLSKLCERLNLDFSEQLLLCPITIESVLNLFILADKHHATELTSKCVEYITENVTEVMQQEDWKKIAVRADLVVILFKHLRLRYGKVMELLEFGDDSDSDDSYEDDYDRHYDMAYFEY